VEACKRDEVVNSKQRNSSRSSDDVFSPSQSGGFDPGWLHQQKALPGKSIQNKGRSSMSNKQILAHYCYGNLNSRGFGMSDSFAS